MFYKESNPILGIIAVEHMAWSGGKFEVSARDYCALAFRLRGKAVIRARCGEYYVNASDILYLPQGMDYTAEYTDTEMLVIHFVTSRADEKIAVFKPENSEKIYRLFLQAHALWKGKKPGYLPYTMAKLYEITGSILEKETLGSLPPHFMEAVSLINQNYKDSTMSIASVCRKAGIGQTVFRQLFKKYYQKTPLSYILTLRLEHARILITAGSSIESAALASGFNDSKYFARAVKKHLGCTPRELKTYGK